MPNGDQVKPWSEVAKNFDPMMPAATYDALRLKYFNDFVKPKVKEGHSVDATYAEFKTMTERPSTISPGAKALLHVQSAAAAGADAALAPLKDLHPVYRKLYDQVQGKEVQLDRIANREGMNTTIPKVAGSFAGQALDFAALSYVLGPLTGALAAEATTSVKAFELVNRVARGGLTFATYDALSAEKGNRLQAGVKGFATGAAFDLALGIPGFLKGRGLVTDTEAADQIVKLTSSGVRPPVKLDVDLAKKVAHNAEIGRMELRPEKTYWSYTLGQRGSRVYVNDVSGQSVPIEIKSGKEYEAYRQVRSLVDQGGSVSHYETHPEEPGRLNEFVRIQTKAEMAKYNSTVIRTPNGKAEAVAKASSAEGVPATAVSKNTVELATVQVQHPVLNKPETETATFKGGRQVVSKSAERPPSNTEVEQALAKRNLDDKTKNFLTRQIERIWDSTLDYEDKRQSIVIAARHVPELLPETYRAKLPAFDVHGNLVKEVAESRVMATAEKTLGYSVNVDRIGKSREGKAVVNITTKLTPKETASLQNALGPEYEIYIEPKGRTRAAMNRLMTDDEVHEMLEFNNVKPEDVDVEAIREGGQAELVRQLEVKKPELFAKRTPSPKISALIDKIPESEQAPFRAVRDGVKAKGVVHDTVQDAVNAGGSKRFLTNPAGQKSVDSQLKEATLDGRLMGSIEDVHPDDILKVGNALRVAKGWKVVPLRGYKPGHFEIVYFRPEDENRILPLIKDYDNYISQQNGRVFNTEGEPVSPVGEEAHSRLGKAFGVGKQDIETFLTDNRDLESTGGTRLAPEISSKPKGQRLTLQREDMERIYNGAEGLAIPNLTELAKDLGIDLPPSLKTGEPLIILTPESDRQVLFHERLHVNGMHAGVYDKFPNLVSDAHKQTALELAHGLMDSFEGYKSWGIASSVEEAYTHAATAVRYGDMPYLDKLAKFDRSVQHVKDFVFDTSNRLLEHTFSDSMDTVPVRIYQRTLWDLMRRSSEDVGESLRQGLRSTHSGLAAWYEPQGDSWIVKEPHAEFRFPTISALWDHLLENDKNFMAPSASLRAEMGGVRGPMTPVGKEPNGAPLPLPDGPVDGPWVGASAASALWRPFFPWLSSLDESLNRSIRAKGQNMPLYEYAKHVDDQFREGDRWLQSTYEKMHDLLAPFKGAKMHSVFEYLTYPEAERTTKLMEKYGLSQKEAIRAHEIWDFMKDFRAQTNINLSQYMLEYHPKLRGFSFAPERVFGPIGTPQTANLFDKLIRHEGKWDPQDAHIGKFLHVMIREGMEVKFTGQALKDLERLVEKKTPEGTYVIPNAVRWPMSNYVKYMRSIPDTSQQMMNKMLTSFTAKLNERIKGINKGLPTSAQIPELTAPPRQLLNRFMLLSYSMGLGLRPAIAIRDGMQAFTGGLTVMGPARFARAFTRFMMSPATAMKFADDAGGLLRKNNIGELYGDILSETPIAGAGWMDRVARWSNMLMSPSRWGHNFARAITFNGEYSDAVDAIKQYRAGKISVDHLLENTSMWFMDRPAQSILLKGVNDVHVPVEDIAKRIALESVDLTQWPYRRGTQPNLLRYGAGRIFGQYGVWPANYADFLYRIGRKFSERPQMAARTAAMWAAVNYASTHAMEAAGADTSRWFWQSPAGFAGSPHWDLVHSIMVAPENTEEGRAARKTIIEYPLNFIPAMSEMKSVAKAIEEGHGNEWPPSKEGLLRALGFKPIDQVQQDQDWQDTVKEQLGYKAARRRR